MKSLCPFLIYVNHALFATLISQISVLTLFAKIKFLRKFPNFQHLKCPQLTERSLILMIHWLNGGKGPFPPEYINFVLYLEINQSGEQVKGYHNFFSKKI